MQQLRADLYADLITFLKDFTGLFICDILLIREGGIIMIIKQIRNSQETKAMIEKLKEVYRNEKFEKEDLVTMTSGYVLNTAFSDVEHGTDWSSVIDSTVNLEARFYEMVKDSKTPITRFRLSEKTAKGINALTKKLSNDLGLKVQIGFTVKLILRAALLQRKEEE